MQHEIDEAEQQLEKTQKEREQAKSDYDTNELQEMKSWSQNDQQNYFMRVKKRVLLDNLY